MLKQIQGNHDNIPGILLNYILSYNSSSLLCEQLIEYKNLRLTFLAKNDVLTGHQRHVFCIEHQKEIQDREHLLHESPNFRLRVMFILKIFNLLSEIVDMKLELEETPSWECNFSHELIFCYVIY